MAALETPYGIRNLRRGGGQMQTATSYDPQSEHERLQSHLLP
jgi:hypothetical protein